MERTADGLGAGRATPTGALFEPLLRTAPALMREILGPLRPPRHPLAMARFAPVALRSAVGLARSRFEGERARALLAGCSAHSMLSLSSPASAAFGVVLMMSAHDVGWPVARGGSQRLADALAAHLRSLGGEIETGRWVESLDEVAGFGATLLDVTPRQLVRLAGPRLPARYARRLGRYRYGPGVFKLDWALDGADPLDRAGGARAGTVHVGGTLEQIAASEQAAVRGEHSERPFVLLVQPSLFDDTRAPEGKHTAWAYCHVPSGSTRDMTDVIESQVERFAPGFRDLIAARVGAQRRGHRAAQPELRRRRHQRRCPGPPPALHAPGCARGPVLDAGGRSLPLLVVDAAGRRRARDVRVLRSPRGPAQAP